MPLQKHIDQVHELARFSKTREKEVFFQLLVVVLNETAVLISDPWQGKGFGSEPLKLLVQIGRKEGLRRSRGHISPENSMMKNVAEQVGFSLHFDPAADKWLPEIKL